MKTWVGTSGYQYPEWKGTFYPEDLSAAKMLPYYAERFSTTEINYSFRRIPSPKTIAKWVETVPADFRFSLKAPQKITHWSKLRDCGETLAYFHQVITGLGEKLGPVLFQLPPTFKADAVLLGDFLREIPDGMRGAFEFRDPSWLTDEIYGLLQSRNIALCIAESSELAVPLVATAEYGYFRLRREDYTDADIEKWAERILLEKKKWKEVFVYFKHEESGVGPRFARQFIDGLEKLGTT